MNTQGSYTLYPTEKNKKLIEVKNQIKKLKDEIISLIPLITRETYLIYYYNKLMALNYGKQMQYMVMNRHSNKNNLFL